MNIIKKFQTRLTVSKINATWRVIAFCGLIGLFIQVLVGSFLFFPYQAEFVDTVDLIPGNHTQVQNILDGEVLVGKEQFLQIMDANTTFISLGEKTISYMTKVDGVSYRYNQDTPINHGFYGNSYFVYSQEIEKGTVIRKIHRNTGIMVGAIIIPLVILFLLFLFTFRIQIKHVSGYGKNGVYVHVWVG